MRMSQQLQVLNLSFYSAHHVTAGNFAPRDNLQSYFLFTDFMNSQFHLSKRSFSQRFDNPILTEALIRPRRLWLVFAQLPLPIVGSVRLLSLSGLLNIGIKCRNSA